MGSVGEGRAGSRRVLTLAVLGATAGVAGPVGAAADAHAQTQPSPTSQPSSPLSSPERDRVFVADALGDAASIPQTTSQNLSSPDVAAQQVARPRIALPAGTTVAHEVFGATAPLPRIFTNGAARPGLAAPALASFMARFHNGREVPGSAPNLPAQNPTFFPVPVQITAATSQVITVKASGSHAAVTVWQKRSDGGWDVVATKNGAHVGSAGITDGSTRIQGTNTTPTGAYTITQGFGVASNPGTLMPYHQVTDQDWWVEDPTSVYYNQMRTAAQGGFHLTEAGDDGSEHLIEYPVQYHNALVINFNTDPAVTGRGAGIFLHDLGPQAGATAGCVAVPETFLTQVVQWIDPAQHPLIAIG
jgi:L,D-peptidoglycan transpeptidase YkuD (ErfK/YbiS/YcfS/YnhG family)